MSTAGTVTPSSPSEIAPRVFHYHADASPFGGTLTVDANPVLIPTAGATSLSQAGGQADSPVHSSSVAGISVKRACSTITGGLQGSEWVTEVSSEVYGLDILGVVTADSLICKLKVSHPSTSSPSYPSICFEGCAFNGLKVNGKDIVPTCDLNQYARSGQCLLDAECCWTDDIEMLSAASSQIDKLVQSGGPSSLSDRYGWVKKANQRRAKGHVICSLVTGFSQKGDCNAFGHVLEVPNFGFLFFGELIVTHGSFGVTMLRAEILQQPSQPAPEPPAPSQPAPPPPINKTPSGTVAIATAHTNGSSSP